MRGQPKWSRRIAGHVHLTWDKTLYTAYSAKDYRTRLLLRDPERQLVRAAHYAQTSLRPLWDAWLYSTPVPQL